MFIPVGILIGYYEGLTCKIIILSLMGVDYTLNPVWWYVWQYLIFCISYPLINQCVILLEYIKKKQKLEFSKYNLIALVVPGILLLVFFLMGYLNKQNILYFIIFCIGYLSSRCSLVKKARKKKWRNSFFMLLIAIVLSAVIVFIQYLMYTHQNAGVAYILTIFPSILILLNVLESNEKLKRICVFWGKQSTYLWLTHNFFLILPFVNLIIGISRMAIIKYIILIMLSLMVSYAFGMLDNMVNMKVLKR